MSDDNPVEQLYQLFIMGLAWLREEKPDVWARRGSSVFSSYARGAGGVLSSVKMLALESWDLADFVSERSVIFEGDKHPGKRELRRIITGSDQYSVLLVVPRGELTPDRLFGPGGYSHAVTDAGIEFAQSVASTYERIVTLEIFLKGWARYKQQMISYNAKAGTKIVRAKGGERAQEESASRYIPPAPYGEEDFEW